MLKTADLIDLERYYADFIYGHHYPKAERLTNWGKQRFFLAKYFDVAEESYARQQIVLRYQQQYVYLNISQAPDFMQQTDYLLWLRQQLQHALV